MLLAVEVGARIVELRLRALLLRLEDGDLLRPLQGAFEIGELRPRLVEARLRLALLRVLHRRIEGEEELSRLHLIARLGLRSTMRPPSSAPM